MSNNLKGGLLACMLISACSGTALQQDGHQGSKALAPVVTATKQPAKPVDDELVLLSRIGNLPRQNLAENSCGLFLWANMPRRTMVFFADNISAQATVMLDGSEMIIPLTKTRGDSVYGLFSTLTYENAGYTVTVSYEAEIRDGLRNGAVVRKGTWRIVEKDGWEVILPVSGLIGCT